MSGASHEREEGGHRHGGRQRHGGGSGPAAGGRWLHGGDPLLFGKGEALAQELGGFGVTGSNQNPDDIARIVSETKDRYGRIDVLVNSAGHGPRAPVLELTDAQWHTGMDVYLLNVIRPSRLVAPIMAEQKGGAIINISSAWAFEPTAMFPTSAVFRAGLAAFTKLFADQYGPHNVRMNNVLPGWIDSLPATEERRAGVPLGRYGRSEEIAATIAFLAPKAGPISRGRTSRWMAG